MTSAQKITRYVRFERPDGVSYGIWDNDTITELKGNIYNGTEPSGRSFSAAKSPRQSDALTARTVKTNPVWDLERLCAGRRKGRSCSNTPS